MAEQTIDRFNARTRWLRRFSYWMPTGPDVKSRNVRNVMIDAIGIGFSNAATPFLPVFLARLGASDFAVGLLTALPALAGFLFSLPIGRFLSRQRFIVPWFSVSRLVAIAAFAVSGLVPFFLREHRVEAILLIWALATLPQTMLNISFTLVMAGVAGANDRFYLMSRRWSMLGLTTAITVAVVGLVLDQIAFPLNYQLVFIALSLGGLFSFNFSSHITLPAQVVTTTRTTAPLAARLRDWFTTIRGHRRFMRFTASQLVYRLGLTLALPLFPLYYVHNLRADDTTIGLINTTQAGVLLVAYFIWARLTKRRGVRFALLATTSAISLYPILLALTSQIGFVILLAGLAGIFSAGIDLVFFDMLVSSYPTEASAMFVGFYQTVVYVVAFVGPLAGTALSGLIGVPGALMVAGGVRIVGFILLAYFVQL